MVKFVFLNPEWMSDRQRFVGLLESLDCFLNELDVYYESAFFKDLEGLKLNLKKPLLHCLQNEEDLKIVFNTKNKVVEESKEQEKKLVFLIRLGVAKKLIYVNDYKELVDEGKVVIRMLRDEENLQEEHKDKEEEEHSSFEGIAMASEEIETGEMKFVGEKEVQESDRDRGRDVKESGGSEEKDTFLEAGIETEKNVDEDPGHFVVVTEESERKLEDDSYPFCEPNKTAEESERKLEDDSNPFCEPNKADEESEKKLEDNSYPFCEPNKADEVGIDKDPFSGPDEKFEKQVDDKEKDAYPFCEINQPKEILEQAKKENDFFPFYEKKDQIEIPETNPDRKPEVSDLIIEEHKPSDFSDNALEKQLEPISEEIKINKVIPENEINEDKYPFCPDDTDEKAIPVLVKSISPEILPANEIYPGSYPFCPGNQSPPNHSESPKNLSNPSFPSPKHFPAPEIPHQNSPKFDPFPEESKFSPLSNPQDSFPTSSTPFSTLDPTTSLILTCNLKIKEKIVNYQLLKRELMLSSQLLKKISTLINKKHLTPTFQEIKQNNESIEQNLQIIHSNVQEITERTTEIFNTVTKGFPKPIQLLHKTLPRSNENWMKFSPDSVKIQESQSINRAFHEFTFLNTKDFELKHLKLVNSTRKTEIMSFGLEPFQEFSVKIEYLYEVIMNEGCFDVQVLCCSMPMSEKLRIPWIEVRFEGVNSLVVTNRFLTKENCFLVMNEVVILKFKIVNFGMVVLEVPTLEKVTIWVMDESSKVLSNVVVRES